MSSALSESKFGSVELVVSISGMALAIILGLAYFNKAPTPRCSIITADLS